MNSIISMLIFHLFIFKVGLAGSSAIVTATLKCLMHFFNLTETDLPKEVRPQFILDVEKSELHINAGQKYYSDPNLISLFFIFLIFFFLEQFFNVSFSPRLKLCSLFALGVPPKSRILTADSHKLNFSTLIKVPVFNLIR